MFRYFRKKIIPIAISLLIVGAAYSQETPAVDSTSAQSPGKALLFSFVPGGGQLYNKHPLKALLFAGVFTYYSIGLVNAEADFKNNPTDSELHRVRNDKIWMMSLTWTLNLLDAYVDAQFWDFEKYEIDDQDLPENEQTKLKEMETINDTE